MYPYSDGEAARQAEAAVVKIKTVEIKKVCVHGAQSSSIVEATLLSATRQQKSCEKIGATWVSSWKREVAENLCQISRLKMLNTTLTTSTCHAASPSLHGWASLWAILLLILMGKPQFWSKVDGGQGMYPQPGKHLPVYKPYAATARLNWFTKMLR